MIIRYPPAIRRLKYLQENNRIVRGVWNNYNKDGEEISCWTGAFHPSIQKFEDVYSAYWCPRWLIELSVAMNDNSINSAPVVLGHILEDTITKSLVWDFITEKTLSALEAELGI